MEDYACLPVCITLVTVVFLVSTATLPLQEGRTRRSPALCSPRVKRAENKTEPNHTHGAWSGRGPLSRSSGWSTDGFFWFPAARTLLGWNLRSGRGSLYPNIQSGALSVSLLWLFSHPRCVLPSLLTSRPPPPPPPPAHCHRSRLPSDGSLCLGCFDEAISTKGGKKNSEKRKEQRENTLYSLGAFFQSHSCMRSLKPTRCI